MRNIKWLLFISILGVHLAWSGSCVNFIQQLYKQPKLSIPTTGQISSVMGKPIKSKHRLSVFAWSDFVLYMLDDHYFAMLGDQPISHSADSVLDLGFVENHYEKPVNSKSFSINKLVWRCPKDHQARLVAYAYQGKIKTFQTFYKDPNIYNETGGMGTLMFYRPVVFKSDVT